MPENQSNFPFRILGVADDGQAYFLDRHERLFATKLEHLNSSKILQLASLEFWKSYKTHKMTREDWMEIQDDLIHLSGSIDFDLDNIRGRGACREKSGGICYHDGQETIGDINDKRIYLKKRKIDMGINVNPASKNLAQKIGHLINELNFETKLDTIRCLSWSILSPFSGALPWRPAILITGESGSGKTTVVDYVIKRLANPYVFNGGESTPAYIRNKIGNDSCAIVLEELEADTQKKRINREELFSMIRQSTSDDAPISGKATRDGGFNEYIMKNMFCCVAVSPEIEAVADENRIFRINIIKKKNSRNWRDIKAGLITEMTDNVCQSIRALTWKKFPQILDEAAKLTQVIEDITGHDTRSSYADALLFSAYFLVWRGETEINIPDATDVIKEIMSKTEIEQKRDETDEILQRILAEPIYLAESHKTMSMFEVLTEVNKSLHGGINEYKRAAGIYGIAVLESGQIAMQNYNHKISEIIDRARGYDKLFKRHKKYKMSKNCNIPGIGTHNCMIFDIEFEQKKEEPKIVSEPDWDLDF
jgi:hypothetical protein